MFSYYSLKMLEEELRNVEKLKKSVDEMKKPDNFTYVDVLHMRQYLDEIEKHIKSKIKEKNSKLTGKLAPEDYLYN